MVQLSSIKMTPVGQDSPSSNGWVSLWRDVKEQSFYKDLIARAMFIDMILCAQHKSKRIQVDGVDVFLNTGQLFTKRKHFVDQGIDDSKVKRVLQKLESSGIISRETIKKSKRSIGQRITFLNWKKWQKNDQWSDQPSDQPEAANIKALSSDSDQCSDQPSDQENNNLLKDLKKSMPSSEGDQPDKNQFTNDRTESFDHMWSEWAKCKKLIGVKDNSKKKPTRDRFMNATFPASKVRKLGLKGFLSEVDKLVDLMWEEHEALYHDQQRGVKGFHPIQNTHAVSFLKHEGWRD